MPDEHGRETEEEALERVQTVRQTQIFGDTPTDPTIGDVVVPAHDEEGANVAAAEVASRADDGDDDAADLSPEEAKRQNEALGAQDIEEDDSTRDESTLPDALGVDSDDDDDEDDSDLTAAEKVDRIEAASSVEEVDSLAEGDERVTVQRAADKKRDELSE